ncbi:MAG: universal stress protein, partial [Gemmatimonadaceae bacterium]|nr:universal stress protein [Gemmatimonadaceae bacterium]
VARRLAARTGASVELLTVFEPRIPPPLSARARPSPAQCEQPDRKSAAELLVRVRRQRRSVAPDVRWPTRFEVGYPPFMIAETARQMQANLIILGIGREHPDARRLGSETALRVAHYGDVPVLAIAPHADRPLRNALFVAEGTSRVDAIRLAFEVLERPSRLWVAYPRERKADVEVATIAAHHQAFLSELRIPPGVQLEHAPVDARDSAELVRFAHEHQVDLIVMPVRGRSFEERQLIHNIVAPILRSSHCSVLAVPERDNGKGGEPRRPPHGSF